MAEEKPTDSKEAFADKHGHLPAEAQEYFKSGGERDSELTEQPKEEKKEAVEAKEAPVKVEAEADDPDVEIYEGEAIKPAPGKRMVNYKALAKRNAKIKALTAELEEQKKGGIQLGERLRLIQEAISTKTEEKKEEVAPPKPGDDIFGWADVIDQKLESIAKQVTEGKTQTERQNAQNDLARAYRSDAVRFAQATPDFPDAYTHLMNGRVAELQTFGITDQTQIMAQIAQEEQALIANAMRSGKSPAEMVYALAKTRGYAKKAEEAPKQNGADKKAETEKALDNIAKSQAASKSLTNAGGTATDSLTALKDLSTEEFNNLYLSIKGKPDKLREFFGS